MHLAELFAPRARSVAALIALVLASCAATAPEPTRLRVLAYNIKHGHGMDGKIDLERIAAVIRAQDPDVVTLQEVDRGCARSGGIDQPRVLGELCGMHHLFGPIRPYDGGLYGMAVLSRYPFVATPPYQPGPEDPPRHAVEARIRPPGSATAVIVTGIHLYRSEAERLAQASALLRRYADTGLPVILAGDFNSERGSSVMNRLERAWHNPAKNGPAQTFPADAPVKEIDFVLLRSPGACRVTRSVVVPETVASDHRPILMDLEMSVRCRD